MGFPIIKLNDFTKCTFEYNKNLYKLTKLWFLSTLFFSLCLEVCVALKKNFSEVVLKKNSKNFAPSTYVLQSCPQDKVLVGNE